MKPGLSGTPAIVLGKKGELVALPGTLCVEATGEHVALPLRAEGQSLFFLGKSGMGKSTLLVNMAVQDILQGRGVCVIDPAGHDAPRESTIAKILERIPEKYLGKIIYLDPFDPTHAVGLNMYDTGSSKDSHQARRAAERVSHIIEVIWGKLEQQPTVATLLRNISCVLLENPGTTLLEAAAMLKDGPLREALLRRVHQEDVRAYWQDFAQMSNRELRETTRSTLSRLDGFLKYLRPIVGQSKTTLDFGQVIDAGQILFVKLSNHPYEREVTRLIGTIILAELFDAALTRKNTNIFSIYADEFHYFASADWFQLVDQVRKHNVNVIFGHQGLSQLPTVDMRKDVLRVHNLLVLQVSGDDALSLAQEFSTTPPLASEFEREIHTPIFDVASRLMRGGEHTNRRVTELVEQVGMLRPEIGVQMGTLLNQLVYKARQRMRPNQWLVTEEEKQCYLALVRDIPERLYQASLTLEEQEAEKDRTPCFLTRVYEGTLVPATYQTMYDQREADLLCLLFAQVGNREAFEQTLAAYLTLLTSFLLVRLREHKRTIALQVAQKLTGGDGDILTDIYLLDVRRKYPFLKFPDKGGEFPLTFIARYGLPVYVRGATRGLYQPFLGFEPLWDYSQIDKCIDWEAVDASLAREVAEIIALHRPVLTNWISGFYELVVQLAINPLRGGSGLYQEEPERLLFSFADMRQKIANELSHLPKFTARAKLAAGGEPFLLIEQLASPVALPEFERRLARVIAQTRNKYSRPLTEVEAEIRQRQTQWRNPPGSPPPPPQAHKTPPQRDEPPPTWGV